jgi:uncharacterized protein YqgV (UPF0045/DUF77 family)
MNIQAELTLYPLGEPDLLPAIEDFLEVLRKKGLNPRMGTMSTNVVGDSATLFSAIAEAFEKVAGSHRCVLIVKYSNACPPQNPHE